MTVIEIVSESKWPIYDMTARLVALTHKKYGFILSGAPLDREIECAVSSHALSKPWKSSELYSYMYTSCQFGSNFPYCFIMRMKIKSLEIRQMIFFFFLCHLLRWTSADNKVAIVDALWPIKSEGGDSVFAMQLCKTFCIKPCHPI